MMTPAQCRAARGLLGWQQQELATQAEIAVNTIRKLEGGKTSPHKSTLKILKATFEKAGIEFTTEGGIGVKLKDSS